VPGNENIINNNFHIFKLQISHRETETANGLGLEFNMAKQLTWPTATASRKSPWRANKMPESVSEFEFEFKSEF